MTTNAITTDATHGRTISASAAVEAALDRIDTSNRPEVWIRVRTRSEARAAAARVDAAFERGAALPLRGLTVAVKDNIDVADLPTTAGCPSFAFVPTTSAPCIVALERAGAVVIGKTNMDQFATGLVGTRSPYGAVASVVAAGHIGGGSSSGSAAAVALGHVDLALGTDTAGSGRVPAACQGIVGLKPTLGLVSVDGVLPACRSFDCVSVFARSIVLASRALAVLAETAPGTRANVRSSPPVTTIGVPYDGLGPLDPTFRTVFDGAVAQARRLGYEVIDVPFDLFSQAGALLYGGAFVAERHAAVGAFIDAYPDDVDPSVRSIIQSGASVSAVDLIADQARLDHLKRRTRDLFGSVDAVLMPTIPRHPTIDEVTADPIGVNSRVGIFSFACNLLDLCAVAVPVGTTPSGLPFGVTLMGPAGTDGAIADAAARLLGETAVDPVAPRPVGTEILLAVAGAHLTGQPLNHQLTDLRARLVASTSTAPVYRLHALPTDPPKPGLVRVGSADGVDPAGGDDAGGAPIEVEVWSLPTEGFARFVAAVPPPLAIGQVELADGTSVPGFVCTPDALVGAVDITAHRGWRAYLASLHDR